MVLDGLWIFSLDIFVGLAHPDHPDKFDQTN